MDDQKHFGNDTYHHRSFGTKVIGDDIIGYICNDTTVANKEAIDDNMEADAMEFREPTFGQRVSCANPFHDEEDQHPSPTSKNATVGTRGFGGRRSIQQASDNLEEFGNPRRNRDARASILGNVLKKTETTNEQRIADLEKMVEAIESVFIQHMADIEVIHQQEFKDAEAAHREQLADYQALHDERNAILVRASKNQVSTLVEKLKRATAASPNPACPNTDSVVEHHLAAWHKQDEGQDIATVIAMAKEKRAHRQAYLDGRHGARREKDEAEHAESK